MNLDDWELRPNGDVAVQPLLGYATATLPLGCIVRLESRTAEDAVAAVQLHMSGPQAAELGAALLRLAQRIEDQPKGTAQ